MCPWPRETFPSAEGKFTPQSHKLWSNPDSLLALRSLCVRSLKEGLIIQKGLREKNKTSASQVEWSHELGEVYSLHMPIQSSLRDESHVLKANTFSKACPRQSQLHSNQMETVPFHEWCLPEPLLMNNAEQHKRAAYLILASPYHYYFNFHEAFIQRFNNVLFDRLVTWEGKFATGKLRAAVHTPDGRDSIQRETGRLERWVCVNLKAPEGLNSTSQ